jgi:hypothetical protein
VLVVRPITLRAANKFVKDFHRHNDPSRGHKFSVAVYLGQFLVGVAISSQPRARVLDDGLTIEVVRTCTLGTRNANSKLYGASWQAARAMGYRRSITYTQHGESGASLRAVGYVPVAELPPRASWAESTADERLREMRHEVGNGGVARIRWEITR